MKLNAGIITPRVQETRDFYIEVLGFEIVFENDFYVLLKTPGGHTEISFLLPDHPSQQPVFHKPFNGEGVYITIEVPDVEAVYRSLQQKNIPVIADLRKEPWGDHHFVIKDPNGVSIDIVENGQWIIEN